MDAVGVTDPARCVYVGDRLFDDVCGAQQRRPARDPRAAQHDPGRAGRPHRGRAGRRGRTGWPTSPTSSTAGPDAPRFLHLCAMQKGEESFRSRVPAAPVACFCTSGHPVSPPTSRRGPLTGLQASAVRVLVCPGEHLGSSPEDEFADRCLVQRRRSPTAAARRPCSPPARRTSPRRRARRRSAARVDLVGRSPAAGGALVGRLRRRPASPPRSAISRTSWSRRARCAA